MVWNLAQKSRTLRHIARHRGVSWGRCPVCQKMSLFVERGPYLRDSYRCMRCMTQPRMRALLICLEEVAPQWRSGRILEVAPHGASSRLLAAQVGEYVGTQYYEGVEPGTLVNEYRVEDLQGLTFDDETFDVVVTQDVFEHVPDPGRGFSEVARVLRPGGVHVFTVPLHGPSPSVTRVRFGDKGAEFVLPPVYHGDPVSDGSLVVTDWGYDIVDFIKATSGLLSLVVQRRDRSVGVDGPQCEVVVSRKPSAPSLVVSAPCLRAGIDRTTR